MQCNNSSTILPHLVLTFARTDGDKLNSTYNVVTVLAYASHLPDSVKRTLAVLSKLGEELPSYTYDELKVQIEQTHTKLRDYSDRDLIEYRIMDDSKYIMVMKFLARLELSFQMLKPAAQPIVTLRMVQLSIAHGMSPFSAIGFVHFGNILARLENARDGCRYVKIARMLQEKIGSNEVVGEVIATRTQTLCFTNPLQTTLEDHVQGKSLNIIHL